MDFEFGKQERRRLSLVCASVIAPVWTAPRNWDLTKVGEKADLSDLLRDTVSSCDTLVSYGIDAEVRSLFSLLGVDTLDRLPFKNFRCLLRDHRMLANKNRALTHGKVILGGKVVVREYRAGRDDTEGDKSVKNLLNALLKFLDVWDEDHIKEKEMYRDVCIRHHGPEIQTFLSGIMEYCADDTRHLPALHKAIDKAMTERGLENPLEKALERGLYGALVAEKTQAGYHIDRRGYINLVQSAPHAREALIKDIEKRWPGRGTFTQERNGRWVYHKEAVQRYIAESPPWIKAAFGKTKKKGETSVNKDALARLYGAKKHSLDPEDFLQQIYRYILTASAFRGLTGRLQETGKAKPFRAFMDPVEGVVRTHLNDFGSTSSRSTPSANGYLLAKPAWMRLLLRPPPGHAMIAADYAKQEILAQAILAGDRMLHEDYLGGIYERFGLSCGLLDEKDRGTNAWSVGRTMCKTAVLSMAYGITQSGLATALTAASGETVPEWRAGRYIEAFKRRYRKVLSYRNEVLREYRAKGRLVLPDGWAMWGGNHNPLSVMNFPVQGTCACVMRKADLLCRSHGIVVPMTLHDALYIYAPVGKVKEHATLLASCMTQGFRHVFDEHPWAADSQVELKVVLPGGGDEWRSFDTVQDGIGKTHPVEWATEYRDPRAASDLQLFEKFFRPGVLHQGCPRAIPVLIPPYPHPGD